MRILLIGLFLYLIGPALSAATFVYGESGIDLVVEPAPQDGAAPAQLLFAESDQDSKSEPESGSLVIPGEEQNKDKKQCLNVCKKWGEECMPNPRTGATKCRKTCKEFGEECF